jgi:hypothetical protein
LRRLHRWQRAVAGQGQPAQFRQHRGATGDIRHGVDTYPDRAFVTLVVQQQQRRAKAGAALHAAHRVLPQRIDQPRGRRGQGGGLRREHRLLLRAALPLPGAQRGKRRHAEQGGKQDAEPAQSA